MVKAVRSKKPFGINKVVTLSIMSGLLVAATIVTSFSFSTPSISVNSWARTLSATLLLPEELQ